MKRVCIFAHYDRDDIVDDYVIYYLKALQKICATIIFVSDCNLSKEEIKKIEAITDFVIAKNMENMILVLIREVFCMRKNWG